MAARTQRLIEAAKKPVPEGTYAVGAGLLIVGMSAYIFQILAARGLTKNGYAALTSLWAMVFVVAPGFFQPLEQEVSRALAHRRANKIGGGPLVKRAALLGAILAGTVAVFVIIFHARLQEKLFHGENGLIIVMLIAMGSYFLAHMTRGTLSGNGRFGAYGTMHGSEGIIRLTMCIVLFAVGTGQPWVYGLALALPPLVAVGVSLRGQHGLMEPGPEAPYSELSTALGWLLVGSVLAQLLSYASVLAANLLATTHAQKEMVAPFITGFFLARIPILLFQAVQAALLPKLAGLAAAGRVDDFKAGVRKLVMIVIGLGLIGVVAAVTLGPTVGKILFGADNFTLSARDLGLLALGSGLFILALTLAQGLIALRGYAGAAMAWLTGLVAFVGVAAIGTDLYLRVELAFVAGSAVAAALMGIMLFTHMRGGVDADRLEELVENIEHETLEI